MKSVKLDVEVPLSFNETWKSCPSFPKYQASNYGRVRRFGKASDKTLQQRVIQQGYAVVTISISGKTFVRMVHVLVLDAFVGPKPHQHFVQHIDGDKLNNTLDNLRYVPGISSSGNIASNISNSNFGYLPDDHTWAITERGLPRFSATSLEELLAKVLVPDASDPLNLERGAMADIVERGVELP